MNINRINKQLTAYNKNQEYYQKVSHEQFVRDAKRYIKATKDRRMVCHIGSVSRSGMSRNLLFVEMHRNKTTRQHSILNFHAFFGVMGFTPVKDTDLFRITGCGMDMVFHTNHTIIHDLHYLGFITSETCDVLAQRKPHVL